MSREHDITLRQHPNGEWSVRDGDAAIPQLYPTAQAAIVALTASPQAAPEGGEPWASDDFYSGHPLPFLHDDPAINADILIQALTARLDIARKALAAAAAMQVVEPKLQRIKANAAWAMSETDPRRLLPRSIAYNAASPQVQGGEECPKCRNSLTGLCAECAAKRWPHEFDATPQRAPGVTEEMVERARRAHRQITMNRPYGKDFEENLNDAMRAALEVALAGVDGGAT
jgi:hypothetical protein